MTEKTARFAFGFLRLFMTVTTVVAAANHASSQNFSVFTTQHISFGAFYPGSMGGSIKISAKGDRTVTGDVVPIQMGYAYHPAFFEIEAPAGTIISIMSGADAVLQGSNGGSMLLRIGESLPRSPFNTTVAPPGRTVISIGGTLEVNSNVTNKPGVYSGSIAIIFNQE